MEEELSPSNDDEISVCLFNSDEVSLIRKTEDHGTDCEAEITCKKFLVSKCSHLFSPELKENNIYKSVGGTYQLVESKNQKENLHGKLDTVTTYKCSSVAEEFRARNNLKRTLFFDETQSTVSAMNGDSPKLRKCDREKLDITDDYCSIQKIIPSSVESTNQSLNCMKENDSKYKLNFICVENIDSQCRYNLRNRSKRKNCNENIVSHTVESSGNLISKIECENSEENKFKLPLKPQKSVLKNANRTIFTISNSVNEKSELDTRNNSNPNQFMVFNKTNLERSIESSVNLCPCISMKENPTKNLETQSTNQDVKTYDESPKISESTYSNYDLRDENLKILESTASEELKNLRNNDNPYFAHFKKEESNGNYEIIQSIAVNKEELGDKSAYLDSTTVASEKFDKNSTIPEFTDLEKENRARKIVVNNNKPQYFSESIENSTHTKWTTDWGPVQPFAITTVSEVFENYERGTPSKYVRIIGEIIKIDNTPWLREIDRSDKRIQISSTLCNSVVRPWCRLLVYGQLCSDNDEPVLIVLSTVDFSTSDAIMYKKAMLMFRSLVPPNLFELPSRQADRD